MKVRVNELVLEGFAAADAALVQRAFADELARLAAPEHAPVATRELALQVRATDPRAIGVAAARALHGKLSR